MRATSFPRLHTAPATEMVSQVAEVVDEGVGEGEGMMHVVLVTFSDNNIALVVCVHIHACNNPFCKAVP